VATGVGAARFGDATMYVCLCNGLTDRQVRAAIAGGACRLRDIYAGCGCKAQCGTCARTMMGLLREPAPAPCGGGMSGTAGAALLAAPTEA
jgi:bacterioferritin-associated ferredoxin